MNNPLTPDQKAVLEDGATEAPFSGALLEDHGDGTYHCARCGALLFGSDRKFDSGSGWPSFDEVAANAAVKLKPDGTLGMQRVEVICANCGGHLGHVFDDGPAETTGKRYCINSCALNFNGKDGQLINGDTGEMMPDVSDSTPNTV